MCIKEQHPRAGQNTQHVLDEQHTRAGRITQPSTNVGEVYKLTTCQLLIL